MRCVEITMDWSDGPDDAQKLKERIHLALRESGLTSVNVDILNEQGEVVA